MVLTRFCTILAVAATTADVLGAVRIVPKAPGGAFVVGESVSFDVEGANVGDTWRIKSWSGSVIRTDTFGSEPDLDVGPLPIGYYWIDSHSNGVATANRAAFAVVVDPAKRPRPDIRSVYGVDAAFSWCCGSWAFNCPWFKGDTTEVVLRLMRLAGVSHVRERMSWEESNPKSGVYTYGRYLANARRLRENGFFVSGMMDNAPKFANRLERLPSDLVALYRFCRKTGETFRGLMDDFEFWNEPDIGAAPEPVWDYMSAMKAAYLGFKDGSPEMKVAPGAMCQYLRGNYERLEYANGLGDYSDVFNLHTYTPLSQYPVQQGDIRKCLTMNGVAGRPVWVTESGTDSEGDAMSDGVIHGRKAHTPEQEMLVAEFFAKSCILFAQEGVSRNYCFIFTAYNERGGRKDWGFLRADGTVKPSYSVLATQTQILGEKRLLGEKKLGDGLRAFLYEGSDDQQTLVLWTVSELELSRDRVTLGPLGVRKVALPATGMVCLSDMCGSARDVPSQGGRVEVDASRYPVYVSGRLGMTCDITAKAPGEIPVRRVDPTFDSRIVVRVDLDREDFKIADRKCRADLQTERGRMKLHVWNLDEKSKRGRLVVAGGVLEGLPAEWELPAMGEVSKDVSFAPLEGGPYVSELRIGGKFEGRRISEWVAPVYMRGRFLASCHRIPLSSNETANWTRNDSADNFSVVSGKEGDVMFTVSWLSEKDRWFYPTYRLSPKERELIATADSLEFEVRTDQDKVENDFKCQLVYILYEHSDPATIVYQAPLAKWERRSIELADLRRPGDAIVGLRIGCNPKGKRLEFSLRNVQLLTASRENVKVQ